MKIDFVSDVACPWCAVGLWSLDRALERLGDTVDVELPESLIAIVREEPTWSLRWPWSPW